MIVEDEEPVNEDFEPKVVGRGLEADLENREDEQWYLADSEHPYAPFPGNALKWESFAYTDGTSFEGLARENIPHGKGVMLFGNGTGGGINFVEPGDKYEGEFSAGFANGLGSFTGVSGEVYRGEWLYGKRHGCGAVTNFAPFYRELRKGTAPEEAWERTKGAISKRMRYGEWKRNSFVREAGGEDQACSVSDVRGILQEMESVVTKARMFQHKPDGDVTALNLRDEHNVPVPVFQDPLHYPHGTKFLAPGPLGQCHPVPEDEGLRSEMRKHARNYMRIYNQYNLPFVARPGDDLFAAGRLHEIQKLKAEHLRRIAAGEDEATILKDLDKALEGFQEARKEPQGGAAAAQKKSSRFRRKPPPPSPPKIEATSPSGRDGSDIDDSDLVASAEINEDGSNDDPPTILCSLGRRNVGSLAVKAARHVSSELLPRVMRRRPIGRSQEGKEGALPRRQPGF